MLYVSGYNKQKRLYAVTDTDDGSVEWLSSSKLLRTARALQYVGVVVHGVSNGSISVIKPPDGVKPGADWERVLNQEESKADPLGALSPRIKRLFPVAARIRDMDDTTWWSPCVIGVTKEPRRSSGRRVHCFVLNIEVADCDNVLKGCGMACGFALKGGKLVIGVGCGADLKFYTNGDEYSFSDKRNPDVKIRQESARAVEAWKDDFIRLFPEFEAAFIAWFKSKYGA